MSHNNFTPIPMTAAPLAVSSARFRASPRLVITGVAFALCFGAGIVDLVRAWLHIPDAAHGLLIAPVALWIAWRTRLASNNRPAIWSGSAIVLVAVVFYILGRTAGVETVPRAALLLSLVGLTVWYAGWRQLLAWWLPVLLLGLTIPLPESLIAATTLPMQGVAAKMGASLLAWRHIPVTLSGNVIQLPGHTLFVSEACSGLRSLTALVSMALLVGALFLRTALSRVFVLALAVGLAVLVNGIRVFLTGFLVFFVDPALGEGFMHLSEGYLLFLVSLAILALLTWCFIRLERRFAPDGTSTLASRLMEPKVSAEER
jgi:exosortase